MRVITAGLHRVIDFVTVAGFAVALQCWAWRASPLPWVTSLPLYTWPSLFSPISPEAAAVRYRLPCMG